MSYKILEAKINFKDNHITKIAVLIDCTSSVSKPLSDVRDITATTMRRSGYMNIPPSAILSEQLLQKVAAGGLETVDRDKIFPNWENN